MRENILKSLLKCICITISVLFVVIMPAMSVPLPSGYTELEYVQNAASTKISTGVIPTTEDSEYYVRFYCSSINSNYLFHSRGGSTQGSQIYGISGSQSGGTIIGSTKGGSLTSNIKRTVGHIYQVKFTITSSGAMTLYVKDETDGTEATNIGTITNWSAGETQIDLFGNENSNYIDAGTKIFEVYYKENGAYKLRLIPAKNSDNTVGLYDFVSNTFKTATTGSLTAGPEVGIKIATTKYVETAFADSVSELNTTMGTIKNVVDNTIIQADRIGKLHTGKQTRPTDTCPDGAQCLLITEADGSLHWYPICNADGTVGTQSSSSFDVSTFISGILNYQGDDCPDEEYGSCWGEETYFRYDRSAGVATVVDMSTYDETETTIQLSAGEWRVKKNGTGTIYGTSACNGECGSVWYDNGVFTKNTTQTDSGGKCCWCKMTGVSGTDDVEHFASGTLWVFHDGIDITDNCANFCANYCAGDVLMNAGFRGAVLGTSN